MDNKIELNYRCNIDKKDILNITEHDNYIYFKIIIAGNDDDYLYDNPVIVLHKNNALKLIEDLNKLINNGK